MGPISDSDREAAYRDALQNWRYHGYVEFDQKRTAEVWMRLHLQGIGFRDLARLMHEYVSGGGEVDEVRETRDEWSSDYEFHHDLRLEIRGQRVYIETRLHFSPPFEPDQASIMVVNIHAP